MQRAAAAAAASTATATATITIITTTTTLCLKKTVQNCFCQKFVKCLPNLIIFWHTDSTKNRFMWGALILHLA